MSSWLALGLTTDVAPTLPTAVNDFDGGGGGGGGGGGEASGGGGIPGGAFPGRPELCASVEEVEEVAAVAAAALRRGAPRTGGTLVTEPQPEAQAPLLLGDARARREYLGEGHDYGYDLPRGRIPGARWAGWGPSTFVGTLTPPRLPTSAHPTLPA